MINSSRSLRCYLKATSGSPLIEFTSSAANSNDSGDGGGATVFTFLPISAFEMLAEELSEMFKQELLLKRLLVVELLSVTFQKHELFTKLSWAEDLYHGEADDLSTCSVYSKETAKPLLPKLNGCRSDSAYLESDKHPSNDILQVYLTTWLAEVNIDTYRVEEIFATVGEEMRTSLA
ncbi:uncharacterized protein LOC141639602 [Silene latifolia]|uniref:uncharacterized protein LOC141639602 n=1 Tax=Silene latifolia TaxID=37657 RepID=UPI003D78414F